MSSSLFLRLIRHATTRKERQFDSVREMWILRELRQVLSAAARGGSLV